MPYYQTPDGALHFLEGGVLPEHVHGFPADAVPAAPPAETAIDHSIVPQVVTRRQALRALLAAGKLDQIELLIQSAPRTVQIDWATAGTFERNNPLIAELAPQVGLTEADVDGLFIEAAQL